MPLRNVLSHCLHSDSMHRLSPRARSFCVMSCAVLYTIAMIFTIVIMILVVIAVSSLPSSSQSTPPSTNTPVAPALPPTSAPRQGNPPTSWPTSVPPPPTSRFAAQYEGKHMLVAVVISSGIILAFIVGLTVWCCTRQPHAQRFAPVLLLNLLPQHQAIPVQAQPATPPPSTQRSVPLRDSMLCVVCTEPMYEAFSLSPCNHNLCQTHAIHIHNLRMNCPLCRQPITGVAKDHTLSSIIQATRQP